jgi:hypothetical protein
MPIAVNITPPRTGMDGYVYRGFDLVVFASGLSIVTHEPAEQGRTRMNERFASPNEAIAWIDLYMD